MQQQKHKWNVILQLNFLHATREAQHTVDAEKVLHSREKLENLIFIGAFVVKNIFSKLNFHAMVVEASF